MRRLRFLLRPGWLILALVVAGFAYLCFTVLAPWQLGKNTDTGRRNDLISKSIDADPVPIQTIGAPTADNEWHRVTANGSYVPGSDVLVRLRSYQGSPAYEVLTAFRLADGTDLLVDRGYVRTEQGAKPPPIAAAPSDPVVLTGRIRRSEGTTPGKDPTDQDGYRQVYSIDSAQVSQVMNLPLAQGYLQLDDKQAGGFEPVELPQLDAGPYLSYGLQWLAFGIMAPLGLAYFIRAELRERRKTTVPATVPPDDLIAPTEPSSPPAPVTTEAKLADRYGKRR